MRYMYCNSWLCVPGGWVAVNTVADPVVARPPAYHAGNVLWRLWCAGLHGRRKEISQGFPYMMLEYKCQGMTGKLQVYSFHVILK